MERVFYKITRDEIKDYIEKEKKEAKNKHEEETLKEEEKAIKKTKLIKASRKDNITSIN